MSFRFLIDKCVIERESFNRAPRGCSEPPGKARMMDGRREGGRDGGGNHAALLWMNSRVFLLVLVKDERKV